MTKTYKKLLKRLKESCLVLKTCLTVFSNMFEKYRYEKLVNNASYILMIKIKYKYMPHIYIYIYINYKNSLYITIFKLLEWARSVTILIRK